MGQGVLVALHEIMLVVFSTLTPAGAFACFLTAVLVVSNILHEAERSRAAHLIGLPLALATTGIVTASAHLGTPANALYVIDGIGRSSLSNEMLCTIPFLAVTGAFWLYSFSSAPKTVIIRTLGSIVALLGLVCMGGIAFAYSQPTIPTWNTPHTPLSIFFGSISAGVLLFLLTVYLAHAHNTARTFERTVLLTGIGAVFITITVEIVRFYSLQNAGNELYTLAERSPHYTWYIGVYAILMVTSYALAFAVCPSKKSVSAGVCHRNRPPDTRGPLDTFFMHHSAASLILAAVFALAALFTLRFAFYTLYLTVGLSL